MINKRNLIFFTAILTLILFFLFRFLNEKERSSMDYSDSNNERSIEQAAKQTENPNDLQSNKTTENRTVEIHLNNEYIINKDNNTYQTDKKGTIKGNILYKQSTLKEEQRAIFAFLEDDDTPINIEINGKVDFHHIVDVPSKGVKEVPFTITDLPPGEHIIYIISEKVLSDEITDPIDIYNTQKTVAGNYLSVKVNNYSKKISTIKSTYNTAQKVKDIENENPLVMQMYEDSNLTKEVEYVENDSYFLTIENQYDFGLNAHLKLISEYKALELQQVHIPSKSQVVVPIYLKDIYLDKSVRIIMVAEPSEKLDIPFSLREVKKTNRLPVER